MHLVERGGAKGKRPWNCAVLADTCSRKRGMSSNNANAFSGFLVAAILMFGSELKAQPTYQSYIELA
jgi:hypothetical protein